VTAAEAPELGVMKPSSSGRLVSFVEKPQSEAQRDQLKVPPDVFRRLGLKTPGKTHLASMGVYLFKAAVLEELLRGTEYKDFGREVIPAAIRSHKVYAYLFEDYWRDIGTIRSFYEANLDLTLPLPKFNFYDEKRPIFTHARYLPGSKILRSEVDHSILCEGSIINRSKISHSIIGIRSRIGEGSAIARTVVMGADYFESQEEIAADLGDGIPAIGIGRDCQIRGAIVDKNARIGDGVKLINEPGLPCQETDDYVIRDGIIVVPKHAVIPDGTVV
jgi:glucose-1-phosphate adenylyltransferase